MRLSSLSLRGAKRRGNLTQAITISPGVSSDPTGYCEIATAPLGPRNDKPLVFTILTAVRLLRRCSAGRGMPRPYGGCIMLYYLKKPFLTVSKISSAFLPQARAGDRCEGGRGGAARAGAGRGCERLSGAAAPDGGKGALRGGAGGPDGSLGGGRAGAGAGVRPARRIVERERTLVWFPFPFFLPPKLSVGQVFDGLRFLNGIFMNSAAFGLVSGGRSGYNIP